MRSDHIRQWIKLLIGIVVPGVTLYNLYLTIEANRPKLTYVSGNIHRAPFASHPEVISIILGNVGREPPIHAQAFLFTVSGDGAQKRKFGDEEITAPDGGTTLMPNFSYGSANIDVNMTRYLGLFLLCVRYDDKSDNSYTESFIMKERTPSTSADKSLVPLDQIISTKPKLKGLCTTEM